MAFCNVFKKVFNSGVAGAQLVGRLDVITASGGGLYLDGSAIAAAELTYIDGITAIGTAQASKALVLDSSKNITGLKGVGIGSDGTLTFISSGLGTTASNVTIYSRNSATKNDGIEIEQTCTGAKPGTGVYLYREATGALTAGENSTCFSVAGDWNASTSYGGVVAGEFKARSASGNTGTCAQLRGVIANARGRSTTTTLAYPLEVSLDVDAGATITTAALIHANFNNSGTVTTSYGMYMEGVSGYNIGTGIYMRYITTGIDIGACTTGINIEGTTSAITFGAGDGKIVDAAASLSIYGGNTSGDALVLYGSSADSGQLLTITGATGSTFTGKVIANQNTGAASYYTGLYETLTITGANTGSTVGLRSIVTMGGSTYSVGNMFGISCAARLVNAGDVASGNMTGLLTSIDMGLSTTEGQWAYPLQCDITEMSTRAAAPRAFIGFQDYDYGGNKPVTYMFDFGSTLCGVASGSGKTTYNDTIKVALNNVARWMPLSSAEGTFTFAYPVALTGLMTASQNSGATTYSTGLYETLTVTGNVTGSAVGLRSIVQMDGTARTCGNVLGISCAARLSNASDVTTGAFAGLLAGLDMGLATTAGLYAYCVQCDFTEIVARAAKPKAFICFQDYDYAGSYSANYLFDVGGALSGVSSGNDSATAIFRTGAGVTNGDAKLLQGLHILVNGTEYYIPLILKTDWVDS